MVICNNDSCYFWRFGPLDHDVSETGTDFLIRKEGENVRIHLRSLEATAVDHWTGEE
jgi:hypothetical protein